MTDAVRVPSLLLGMVLALAGLSGCVQIPTAGPIERVPGQAEACQNCINVEVAPPATGAGPRDIIEGYLRATSNYQPNYSTARQFLTDMAAESWRPEEGVSVYSGSPVGDDNGARLVGRLVGKLAVDRTYTAKDEEKTWEFGLKRENGEWRIDNPPKGLMVGEYYFSQFYSGYSVYFVGSNNASLVPERIYLPALGNPSNIASALMTALLDGPSKWLEPAAGSIIPAGASPSVASVTITNGIAEVPLTDAVLTLSDSQRSVMASQIVYTLRQVSGVKGVLITVNSQKLRVREADSTSLVIPLDAFSREIDPVPFVTDQLWAVKDGEVQLVTTRDESPDLQPMAGPLGKDDGEMEVDSLAVSVQGDRRGGGHRRWAGPPAGGDRRKRGGRAGDRADRDVASTVHPLRRDLDDRGSEREAVACEVQRRPEGGDRAGAGRREDHGVPDLPGRRPDGGGAQDGFGCPAVAGQDHPGREVHRGRLAVDGPDPDR